MMSFPQCVLYPPKVWTHPVAPRAGEASVEVVSSRLAHRETVPYPIPPTPYPLPPAPYPLAPLPYPLTP